MPCEHYKDALIDVAASGAAPQGELRAHLSECVSCRAVFDEEQSLFSAIDSGLQATVNAEVPPSLILRVRARLGEVVVPRFRWLQPLVFASAGVALAFVAFLMVRPRHVTPEETARHSPIVVPASTAPATSANPEDTSSEGSQLAAIPARRSHVSRNSTGFHSAASGNVEVLVPPDEREAFDRLVAVLNERGDVAASLLAKAPEKKDKDGLAIVDPVQIPDIEIKSLEGAETETSDGAGEKH